MSIFRQLWRKFGVNPFDALLKKSVRLQSRRFLIAWNRGLGDIPLGLYALVQRIYTSIPDASITFITRPDLQEGFELLGNVNVIIEPSWKRGQQVVIDPSLQKEFDVVIEKPDPTAWCMWQIGKLVPKLNWQTKWDQEACDFPKKQYLGIHAQTQTSYGYEKNWPLASFQSLLDAIPSTQGILLFGAPSPSSLHHPALIDLRGKTSLKKMLALVKNSCTHLLVPDSGILSMVYYLNYSYSIKIVSLWADPKQGVLKQNVSSPNPALIHHPLIAPDGKLSQLPVKTVLEAL